MLMPERIQMPQVEDDDSLIAIRPIKHEDFDAEPTISIDEGLLKNISVRDRKIFVKLLVIGRKLDLSVDNQVYHNEAIRNLARRVARIEKWINFITGRWGVVTIICGLASPYVLPKLIPFIIKVITAP